MVKHANEELVDQNATRVHVQWVNCVKEMCVLMVAELIQTAAMTCHVLKESAKINVLKINVATIRFVEQQTIELSAFVLMDLLVNQQSSVRESNVSQTIIATWTKSACLGRARTLVWSVVFAESMLNVELRIVKLPASVSLVIQETLKLNVLSLELQLVNETLAE